MYTEDVMILAATKHLNFLLLRTQTTYPLLASLGNPTKAVLSFRENHNFFSIHV